MNNSPNVCMQTDWFDLPWTKIPWKKIQRTVWKLQKRIYRAMRAGQKKKVKALQRLLLKSTSALLLAIRKVTEENKGKKTPGIDGVASLTPKQRKELARYLNQTGIIGKNSNTTRSTGLDTQTE